MSDMQNREKIIQLSGVDFFYGNSPVLEDIDLEISPGEFIAVLGPNGGGKTTLIKLILGLLTPDCGSIRVFGREPKHSVHRMGYLPQHIDIKEDIPVTVLEIVLMGLVRARKFGWFYSHRDRKLAFDALEKVEMEKYANCNITRLSGGQKQRVFIARALVSNPDLLILDEPTSNIDPQGKFCFYEFLTSLSSAVTILVVSHDLSITSAGIDSLGCLNRKLVYSPEPKLTQEMFELLYGVHRHTCPITRHGPYPEFILPS
ncbi:MAG: metal ABC transporter ATP-binding protein [Thermodesulfobacteriota bacterium]